MVNHRFSEARQHVLLALEIDKTHTEALRYAVDVNLSLSRYEEAILHADNMMEIHPENPLVW